MSLPRLSPPDEWDTLASKLARGLTAAGLAGTVAATIDLAFADAALSVRALISSAGLGLGFGLVLGALWAGLAHLLAKSPRFVSWMLWLGLAFGSFGGVASDLRAVANLGTRYHGLALGTLAACGLAALGTGALLILVQPTRAGPPPLMRARRWVRWGVAVGLTASAFVLTYVDRTQFPGQYASFHIALQSSALFCWAVALLMSGVALAPRRRAVRIGAGILAGLLVVSPFVLLHAPLLPASETVLSRPFSALPFRVARLMADVDRDGSSPVLGGGDCAPFDATINPQQREVPDNGIDDNCFGGDAHPVIAAAHQGAVPVPSKPSPQHIVLITIDTLRPDRMSVYGYERDTTPELKRWFEDGTRYTRAYAAGGWTSIAIPAILRGVNPRRLQWTRMYATNQHRYVKAPLGHQLRRKEKTVAMFLLPLSDPHWPLATYLRRRGMFTAAVVDGGFTEMFSQKWGNAEGFDTFVEIGLLEASLRNDAQTSDRAIEVLRDRPRDKPFFLWVHYFGPHAPSKRHPDIPAAGNTESDRYDAEITYVDRHVGRLLRAVDEQTDRPVTVLLAADHGERIYNKRSRGHGRDHSEQNIRVPLLVKGPGFQAGAIDAVVGAIDLMPTILDVTETPAPDGFDGLSLRDVTASPDRYRDRALLVDTFIFDKNAGDTGTTFKLDLVSAVSAPHKLIMNRLDHTLSLQDVDDPALANKNLLGEQRADSLEQQLHTYLDETGGTPLIVD